LASADHDHHHDATASHDDGSDPADPADHHPGAGHHHADAPVAGLIPILTRAPVVTVSTVPGLPAEAVRLEAFEPAGLRRPPRTPDMSI
jgi:hypothetical protein